MGLRTRSPSPTPTPILRLYRMNGRGYTPRTQLRMHNGLGLGSFRKPPVELAFLGFDFWKPHVTLLPSESSCPGHMADFAYGLHNGPDELGVGIHRTEKGFCRLPKQKKKHSGCERCAWRRISGTCNCSPEKCANVECSTALTAKGPVDVRR